MFVAPEQSKSITLPPDSGDDGRNFLASEAGGSGGGELASTVVVGTISNDEDMEPASFPPSTD